MEWAELGSLEDLIDSQLGKAVPGLQDTSGVSDADDVSGNPLISNQGVHRHTRGSTGTTSKRLSFPTLDRDKFCNSFPQQRGDSTFVGRYHLWLGTLSMWN